MKWRFSDEWTHVSNDDGVGIRCWGEGTRGADGITSGLREVKRLEKGKWEPVVEVREREREKGTMCEVKTTQFLHEGLGSNWNQCTVHSISAWAIIVTSEVAYFLTMSILHNPLLIPSISPIPRLHHQHHRQWDAVLVPQKWSTLLIQYSHTPSWYPRISALSFLWKHKYVEMLLYIFPIS